MINVSVEGVKDAFDILRDIIVPWQREQAERKSKLENARRQAEIKFLNAQALTEQAKIEREKAAACVDHAQAELILAQARKTEAEARLLIAQAERAFTEIEKEKGMLMLQRISLAERIVEKYAPSATGAEKINYIIRLLPEIDTILSSGIEVAGNYGGSAG